jgi:hypothetical protein
LFFFGIIVILCANFSFFTVFSNIEILLHRLISVAESDKPNTGIYHGKAKNKMQKLNFNSVEEFLDFLPEQELKITEK